MKCKVSRGKSSDSSVMKFNWQEFSLSNSFIYPGSTLQKDRKNGEVDYVSVQIQKVEWRSVTGDYTIEKSLKMLI